ncbi:MAG: HRDC domain-containing protein, partial [Pseudomonadota bacterium]
KVELREDPKASSARKTTKTPLPEHIDGALWEALRERRRELAEEQGIPPYVVFHDRTLQEMCELRPQSVDSFAQLTGVGERKCAKYASDFIAVIKGLEQNESHPAQ